jgi:predicted RNase H-like HicB family nuclease
MATRKQIEYYLNFPWSYTIEQETSNGQHYFIIRVNELPGICTDAETVAEGMELIKEAIEGAVILYLKNGEQVPEPIKKEHYKGNIAYRTTSERQYHIAKLANAMHKSISKTLDALIDKGLENLRAI